MNMPWETEDDHLIPITDVWDPITRTHCLEYGVSFRLLTFLRYHASWLSFSSHVARRVLRDPENVFQGERSDGTRWLCYTSRVTEIKNNANKWTPCPDGMVFVAYVGSEGSQMYHWGLEEQSSSDPSRPVNSEDGKFKGELIWTKNN